jgi:ABC-type sugar transport system permease subunit
LSIWWLLVGVGVVVPLQTLITVVVAVLVALEQVLDFRLLRGQITQLPWVVAALLQPMEQIQYLAL